VSKAGIFAKPYDGVRIEAGPMPFFETPVIIAQLHHAEALLADLREAIAAHQAVSAGISRSNHGGWHSNTDMLDWGGAAANKLAQTAVNLAKRMSFFHEAGVDAYDWHVRMWANVTPKGGLNQLHAHPQNLWAGVLYLDMGDGGSGDDVGGALYFEDPRFPMCAMHHTAFRLMGVDGQPQAYQPELRPRAGDLIVFPAWLRHGVRAYTGDGERISIAMNIDAKERQR
jgi:uncharacterized protein (TIGR02466 family)